MNASTAVPIGVWLAAIAVLAIAGQTVRNEVWRIRCRDLGIVLAFTLVVILAAVGLALVVTL